MHQLNAAFYCFTPLSDLPSLKRDWLARLQSLGVKGTIILAPEGINGFLAGPREALRDALSFLRSLPSLAALHAKESVSDSVPFDKLCIKVKKEIVTFRKPVAGTAPRISPEELERWFSEGRKFHLLDTRNAYEARLGTFSGATVLPIDHFVDFAEAIQQLPEEWKTQPVVTFCTGGIRCEKAAPFLASNGFTNVLQLDDGILGYFEKVGGAHWKGECFVFDARISLTPDLLPSGARLCSHCQGPVPRTESLCIHCGQAT